MSKSKALGSLLLVGSLLAFPAVSVAENVPHENVPGSTARWLDSHVQITTPRMVEVTATGQVDVGAGWGVHGPEGTTTFADVPGYPAATTHRYGLVVRLTSSRTNPNSARRQDYAYGDTRQFCAAPGHLWLTVDDDQPSNNTGSYDVTITLGAACDAGPIPFQGSISGVVSDATGPLGGSQVVACPAGHIVADASCLSDTTGTDGSYAIGGLASGAYVVQAWPGSGSDIEQRSTLTLAAGDQAVQNFVLRAPQPLAGGVSVDGPSGSQTGGVPTINFHEPSTIRIPLGQMPAGQPNSQRLIGSILELALNPSGVNPVDVVLFEVHYGANGRPDRVSQLIEGPGETVATPASHSTRRPADVIPCVSGSNAFAFSPSPAGGVQLSLDIPGGSPLTIHFDPVAFPSPQPTGNAGLDLFANGLVSIGNGVVGALPGIAEYNTLVYGLNVAANAVNGDYAGALESAVFNFGVPALGERLGIPGTPFHGPASFIAWNFSTGVAQGVTDAVRADPSSSDPCGLGRLGADLYVDPSGTVLTTTGIPVEGAKVTLTKANPASGAFAAVPNRSTIMSPANRRNPDHTNQLGMFGWDVIPGSYVVAASLAGCHGLHGARTGVTPTLKVPPPATNLTVRLVCPKLTRTPTDVRLTVAREQVARARGSGSVTVLTAVVTAAHGHGRPMGTVTFTLGRMTLSTLPLGRSGSASLTVPGSAAGVRATYSGDARYAPGTSKRG